MYVVSYCMVVAFHPELNIRRRCIYRSYDQSPEQLASLSHFEVLGYNFFSNVDFFNMVTLKQLEDASFCVLSREKNTALAEMFSVELKFTVDTLKNWFNKTHKINHLELKLNEKVEFLEKNPVCPDTLCCLCDFPLESRASVGWSDHVIKAEYLFLANIYNNNEMKLMNIDNFELCS